MHKKNGIQRFSRYFLMNFKFILNFYFFSTQYMHVYVPTWFFSSTCRYGNYEEYTKNRINLMTGTDSHIKGGDGFVVIELLIRTSNNDMQIFRATKNAIEELFMSLGQTAEQSNAEMFLQTIKGYLPLPVIFNRMKQRIVSLKAVRQSTFH